MGGQVFVVPPEYYGLAGLGAGIKEGIEGYQAQKDRKQLKSEHKDDIQYEGLVRAVKLAQDAHASPETVAQIINDHPYTKEHGLSAVQARLTGAEIDDRAYVDAMNTPDEKKTDRQKMLVNQRQFNNLNPEAAVKSADLGVEGQQQNLTLGKQQLVSSALSNVAQAHKEFGVDAALAIKKAYNEELGSMPDNIQTTMDDIDAKIATRLASNPKALEAYNNLKTVGDVRGVAGAVKSANLKDASAQSQINVDNAQIERLKSESQKDLMSAQVAGLKAQMDTYQTSMNNLVSYGATPSAVNKYVIDPSSMSDADKNNIQQALVNYASRSSSAGNQAGQNLTTLSMAIKRGTVNDPTGQLMAKATAEFASSLGDGQQYEAVKTVKHGMFGSKEIWETKPIVKKVDPGPVDDAINVQSGIRTELAEALKGHDPVAVKKDIDALPDTPNKAIYESVFAELTQQPARKQSNPGGDNNKPAIAAEVKTPEVVKPPAKIGTATPAFEQKKIRVNTQKINMLTQRIDSVNKLLAKPLAKNSSDQLKQEIADTNKQIDNLKAEIATSEERLRNNHK